MSLDTAKPLNERVDDFLRRGSEEHRYMRDYMRDPDIAPITNYAKMLQNGIPSSQALSSIWLDAAKPDTTKNEFDPALLNTDVGKLKAQGNGHNLGTYTIEAQKQKNEEEERKKADLNKILSDTLSIGGNVFTFEQVVDNLGDFANFQQAMVNNNQPQQISENALLYLDQNGRPVEPGTPGARLVEKEEERLAAEAKAGQCFLGVSADQTTVVDGVRIDAKEYENQQAMINKIEETKQAIAKLESGEMKLEELPKDMQANVAYWEKNGDRLTDLMNNPDKQNFTGRLEMETARNEFMGEDLPHKMPMRDPILDSLLSAPAAAPQEPANLPTPPTQTMALRELAPAA